MTRRVSALQLTAGAQSRLRSGAAGLGAAARAAGSVLAASARSSVVVSSDVFVFVAQHRAPSAADLEEAVANVDGVSVDVNVPPKDVVLEQPATAYVAHTIGAFRIDTISYRGGKLAAVADLLELLLLRCARACRRRRRRHLHDPGACRASARFAFGVVLRMGRSTDAQALTRRPTPVHARRRRSAALARASERQRGDLGSGSAPRAAAARSLRERHSEPFGRGRDMRYSFAEARAGRRLFSRVALAWHADGAVG